MYQLISSVLKMLSIPDDNINAAYSPEEAFRNFREHKHDLILSDWLKNPGHGIDLTKAIRTNNQSPKNLFKVFLAGVQRRRESSFVGWCGVFSRSFSIVFGTFLAKRRIVQPPIV